jgi:hypothetical protein
MDRHLTRRELVDTRGFICLENGKGRVVPVKLFESSVSSADGWNLIAWMETIHDNSYPKDAIVTFYPAVYPVEEIGPRLRERKAKEELCGPARRDCSLVKRAGGIYRISPSGTSLGYSIYCRNNPSYPRLVARLAQEEFEWRS